MDLKSEFLSKAAEIIAGVIVGYIAYIVSAPNSDLAGMFGIMIGLMTTLVVALLIESYRHAQDLNDNKTLLASLLRHIAEQHEKVSDFTQVLRYGVTRIPRERLIEGFVQSMWRVESDLAATNYIRPEEGWGRAYGELYHEIQRTKIKVNNATIRRVFILDDEDEMNTLRNVMSRQKEVGVHVKYIFRRKIATTSLLKMAADALETLDFDIIDNKYVWCTLLDTNRKIKEGKVLFGREECNKYKRFHDNLFAEASDINY